MSAPPQDEKLLTRYLLGHLSDQAQVEIEDRAFADPEYLAAIEAAEADLIDSYVRGDLASQDRRAFERRFFVSPQRRSKVEFARALATVAAEASPLRLPAPEPTPWTSLFANWNLGLRFAAAMTALAVVAGASWLMLENSRMHNQIAALESKGRELETRNAAAGRELTAEKNRADNLAAQLEKQPVAPTPVIASLVLLPGLTRSETNRVQLAVPAAAQLARIQVQLDARDAFPQFRAELHTLAGAEVLTRGGLRPRQTPAGPSISFDVPASALASGDYELKIEGVAAGRAPQELGFYYFRVLSR